MKHSYLGDSEKSRFEAVGIALALAAILLDMSGAGGLPAWGEAVALGGLVLLSAVFLARGPRVRRLVRWAGSVVLSSWLHRDQERAAAEQPHYRGALRRHRLLLDLTLRELSGTTEIPLVALWFFSRFESFLPRPEYLEALERALLLPEGYFRQGGSYGPDSSLRRLYRYDDLGYGRVFTMSRVRRISQPKRDEILRKLEDLRWEDLRKEGKV
ncbi:MAG: hypothetical protein ACLGI9_10080 [Thermoanaerobaculia bacterium]